MKVSFLVTYYNQEAYVRKSLDSLLDIEKPEEWEILVGDDGSSDDTVNVVMEYIRKYPDHISVHIMPRDSGVNYAPVKRVSANRLNLLEKCTGDYFCVLDGDDWYCDRTFVKDALNIMETQPDISVVLFGYQHVTEGVVGHCATLPEIMDGKRVDPLEYLQYHYIHSGACVHRKAYGAERVAYLKQIGYFDDNDIVINSIHHGEIHSICRVIYSYRQTGTSVYTSMNELEQAILNVQGFDVDRQLVGSKYLHALLERNAYPIMMLYIWRKHLQTVVGEEKCNQYLDGCSGLQTSLTRDIMCFEKLTTEQKKEVRKVVYSLMKERKKLTIKRYLQLMLYKLKG